MGFLSQISLSAKLVGLQDMAFVISKVSKENGKKWMDE